MSPFPDNNPYNFIPLGPRLQLRQGLPSHRRLEGLSGTITLHLTNETPMLVAQRVKPEDETPPKLQNFKIDDRPALPGSALKGMLRSVLEAVTNACFVTFDGRSLDYRMAAQDALHLRAGRITRMPQEDQDGEIEEMERAWIAMCGKPRQVNAIIRGRQRSVMLESIPDAVVSGQEVWVQSTAAEGYINSRGKLLSARTGAFNLVTAVSSTPVTGYSRAVYKITAESIPNIKKRERVFICKDDAPRYSFNADEVGDYQEILDGQLQEHKKRGGFDLTEHRPLSVGALVYFLVEGDRAVRLSRVEIPRTHYRTGRQALLPAMYHKCSTPESLCAACRLFGFVADIHASKGRVTVTDAKWLHGRGEHDRFFPLKVLGEPHPTSCNFYLKDPDDPNRVRNYDGLPILDGRGKLGPDAGRVELRGRKFYYHHPCSEWSTYKCAEPQRFRNVLNQVKPLKPQNTFEFRVHFRNLGNVELGLLLHCLVLESNLRHKLGLAKAVGFGTVKIECRSLLVSRDGDRYASLTSAPRDETGNIDAFIAAFKSAVVNCNAEGVGFDDLENVRKLRRILDPSQAPANMRYPGFEWYARSRNVALPLL